MAAYTFKNYEESDDVRRLRDQMQQMQKLKPGEYQSQWKQKQEQAANDFMNRPDFQYSMNGDPLYQQYKDMYQRQGKLAMQDTMGQAAAMSGGYGSSYGQTAGQQMYDSKLQQLNDRVPELYSLALSKYQMEGQQLLDRYNLASSMEGQDYSRYQDVLSDWRNERDYATGRYDTERSTDYNKWADMDERAYSRYQDQQKMAQKQVEYLLSLGKMPNDELLEMAGYDPQYIKAKKNQNNPLAVLQALKGSIGAGGGGYGGSGGSGGASSQKSPAQIAADALNRGMPPQQVVQNLMRAGLSLEDARKALNDSKGYR